MGKKLTNEEVQSRLNKYFVQKVKLISEYQNKRTTVKLLCEDCGYEWEMKPHNFLYIDDTKAIQHQCPNCNPLKIRSGKIVKCGYCGKEIYRKQSDIEKNKSGYFYCSKECGNIHKNIIRYENGEFDDSQNYRLKAFMKYPHKCIVCGWDEDERILEVHHRDENHNNNDMNNLSILCPTCHRKITLHYYKLLENNTLEKI